MLARLLFISCLLTPPLMNAQGSCEDYDQFVENGWQLPEVQEAMDHYLRNHRMRANWLNQPAPPDQIGSDYYQWLWHNSFGANMKRDISQRFCRTPAQP